jgi:hypothetical protein
MTMLVLLVKWGMALAQQTSVTVSQRHTTLFLCLFHLVDAGPTKAGLPGFSSSSSASGRVVGPHIRVRWESALFERPQRAHGAAPYPQTSVSSPR